MSYFVTGATGFIGRHLVEQLLKRDGEIHVLVREGSRGKLDELVHKWSDAQPGARDVHGHPDLHAEAVGERHRDAEGLAAQRPLAGDRRLQP